MIKEVNNIEDADICDSLLTKLILDERKYNDLIKEDYVVKNHFNKMLNDKNIILLAYYLDDKIVGYILMRLNEENLCLIDGLYVIDSYRNHGIANELLTEVLNRCKKMKIKYIDINVMEKNEIAKRIYQKLGFVEYEVKLRKEI